MSDLRAAALEAAAAARAARIDTARGRLASTLAPADVTGLTVCAELAAQVVFTDGTICLAVADTGGVTLVTGSGEQWTRVGAVADLAALGLLLGGTA